MVGNTEVTRYLRAQGRGTDPVAQRWTPYGLTLKSQDQLIADGLEGDTVAISQIDEARFATLDTAKRMTMVDKITANTWVGSYDERSLRYIWASFGPTFLDVADKNVPRWVKSAARYTDLQLKIPDAKLVYDSLGSDTKTIAQRYLKSNGEFVKAEMARLGIAADDKAPESAPDAKQKDELRELQDAATGLQQLQYAQEAARNAWVGYGLSPADTVSDGDSVSMWVFAPVTYDPSAGAPPPREIPPQFFQHGKVGISQPQDPQAGAAPNRPVPISSNADLPQVAPLRDYGDLSIKYQEADRAIAALYTAFPDLFVIGVDGSKRTGEFAAADSPAKTKAALATAFRTVAKTSSRPRGTSEGPWTRLTCHQSTAPSRRERPQPGRACTGSGHFRPQSLPALSRTTTSNESCVSCC